MKLPRRRFLHLAAGVAAPCILSVGTLGQDAWSQATRTIRFVVPVPPGGAIDILARLLADQIGRAQDLAIVVDNRPGAGTTTATETVSHAAPDGNTVLFMANAFVINPNLQKLN